MNKCFSCVGETHVLMFPVRVSWLPLHAYMFLCVVGIVEEKWLLQEKLKTLESEYEDRIHKLTDKETGREDVINVTVPLQEEKFSTEKIAKIVDSLSSEVIERLSSDVVHELDLYKTQVGYKAAVVEAMVEPKTTGNHPITR